MNTMATKPSIKPNKNRVGSTEDTTPECDLPTEKRRVRLKTKTWDSLGVLNNGRETVVNLAHSDSRKLFNYLRHWRDDEAQTVLCDLLRVSGWNPNDLACTWPERKTASAFKQTGGIPIQTIRPNPVEQWMLQRSTGLMLADCEMGSRGVYSWLPYDPNKHSHLLKKGMVELAWTKQDSLVVVPSVAGAMTVLDLLDEGYYFINRKTNHLSKGKAKEQRSAHSKPKVKSIGERRAERINSRLKKLGDTAKWAE